MSRLILVTGYTGAGKSTLVASLLEMFPAFQYWTTTTTRPPRANDPGPSVEYRHVDNTAYQQTRLPSWDHGEMDGHWFGADVLSARAQLDAGVTLVRIVAPDLAVIARLMRHFPNRTTLIWLDTPRALAHARVRSSGDVARIRRLEAPSQTLANGTLLAALAATSFYPSGVLDADAQNFAHLMLRLAGASTSDLFVKVCGIRRPVDALAAVVAGADSVGILVGQSFPSPDFISVPEAKAIVAALPPAYTTTLVTQLTDVSAIAALAVELGTSALQLHGGSSPVDVSRLRQMLPAVSLLIAVHDTADAWPFAGLVDGVVIDSANAETGQVGGTGLVGDWQKAAELVATYPSPVILAGGLHAGNVAEAVHVVRPAGVDANSGTKGRHGFKDPARLREFVAAVKQVTR